MSRFFKHLALLVAVACFTWVAVLWRWQSTQRDMSVHDIGVYLVALPLVLFVLLLLARWAWAGAVAGAAATQAAAAPAAPVTAATPSPDEAERRATVQLLSAHLQCAAGASAAELLQAAAEGKPRPDLDPELRDEQGLPLMTARIPALDPDATVPDPEGRLRPECRRALASLSTPLADALAALQRWRDRFDPPVGPDAPSRPAAAPAGPAPAAGASVLRVMALWPADFSEDERRQADAWLQVQLRDADVVPSRQLASLPAPAGPAWPEIERLLRLLDREGRQDVLLVVAAHSALGESSVRRLEAAGQLFTSRTPQRPIAGEGAVAMLLAPAGFPAATPDDDTPAPVHLHRAGVARRDKPIDSPGRTSAELAQRCLEQAVDCAGATAGQVGAAVHDADQHTPRAAEALTALLQAQPQLQPADDVVQTGALTGQLGPVAPLLTVALAAHQAATLGQPCLALSVDDASLRLALLARPADLDLTAAPPDAAPAPTP